MRNTNIQEKALLKFVFHMYVEKFINIEKKINLFVFKKRDTDRSKRNTYILKVLPMMGVHTKGWMEQWWALLPVTDPVPSTGWMHIPC